MQMLHACGIKCAGDFPAFEPRESNTTKPIRPDWLHNYEAVKILDPHRTPFPNVNGIVLWMDRGFAMQAVSQLKFMMHMLGMPFQNDAAGKIVGSLRKDTPLALAAYAGLPLLRLNFEDAIEAPLPFAKVVCMFLADYPELDAEKMAAAVVSRVNGATCQRDLSIEARLCGVS